MITLIIWWRRHDEQHNIDIEVEQYNYDVDAIFDALWANETAREAIKTAVKHKTAHVEVLTDYKADINGVKKNLHAIYDNKYFGSGSSLPVSGLVEQVERCERADMEQAVREVQSKMTEQRHVQMFHYNVLTPEERKEVAEYFGKTDKEMATICDQYRLRVYGQRDRRRHNRYNAVKTLTELAKGEYGSGNYGKVIARSKRDGSLWLVSPTYGFDDYNRSRLQTMMPLSQETINAFNRCVTAHL